MANKTSYGIAAQEICELFGDYLGRAAGGATAGAAGSGAAAGATPGGAADAAARPILVISFAQLDEAAVDAVEKSMGALGYAAPACAYAQVAPDAAEVPLDAPALTMMIEGLDPLRLIVADDAVCTLLQDAYRMQLKPDCAARIAGRTSAVFRDLQDLISTDAGKRTAWELFKALK